MTWVRRGGPRARAGSYRRGVPAGRLRTAAAPSPAARRARAGGVQRRPPRAASPADPSDGKSPFKRSQCASHGSYAHSLRMRTAV